MIVGYSFWGYLADVKYDTKGNVASTPDGNAFYSWSIIKEIQERNNVVVSIMPDRDFYGVMMHREKAFDAWATKERYNAYMNMHHIDYKYLELLSENYLFNVWDKYNVRSYDYILHEWRMKIPGRNDLESMGAENWQPDYFIQKCLIKYCMKHNIKLYIFDLDYKLNDEVADLLGNNVVILELGNKWKNKNCAKKVYIPFSFESINYFDIKPIDERENDLIYVGNRYERDWCIDKYIPEYLDNCIVHGNWKESGRDSENRWPGIKFGKRLQTKDMFEAYSNSVCTILLAKHDYCKYNFMTARIIEAIFYGTVPLFISEYGEETIKEYAGEFADVLTVNSKSDVVNKIIYFKENKEKHKEVIEYLRKHLSKMDAKSIVQIMENML